MTDTSSRSAVSPQPGSPRPIEAPAALYYAAFQTAIAAQAITDVETGRFIDVNAAYCQMTGYSREELIGHTTLELGLWLDSERRTEMVARLLRDGYANDVEIRYRTRQGTVSIQLSSFGVIEAEGRRLIVTTAQDITERKKAEDLIRRANQKSADALSAARAAYWEYDVDARLFTFNERFYELHGIADAGGLQMSDATFTARYTHPESAAQVNEVIRWALFTAEAGASRTVDGKVRTTDGSEIWVSTTVWPEKDATGRTVRLRGVNQVITERKQAEMALRRSEEQYRALVSSLDSVVATVNAEGQFLYVNEVASKQYGLPASQQIGKTMHELFPETVASRHLESVRRAINTDRGGVYETRTLIKGEWRWYRTSIQPVHDEHGNVLYALINSTDIHELKVAQQELEELNRTLEARVQERTAEVADLYENAPAGYHSLDAEGRFLRVNRTELAWLGRSAEEVIGRPFTDFITSSSRKTFAENFPAYVKRGYVHDLQFELVRPDGSVLPVLVSATALYDANGKYVMSRSTMVDITERRQAEEALRLANAEMARALRLRDEFLANMSHELRTPLHGILALSETLQEGIYGPVNDAQSKAVRNIDASGRHLLALIGDLLDLAKIDAGKFELERDWVRLDDLCQASVQMVREMATKKQIRLGYQTNETDMMLYVDNRRFKQMLVNLLSNAVKFTSEGGKVKLQVTVRRAPAGSAAGGGPTVEFAVRDTGIGIAPENLPRLFQPFVQLDASLSRQFEGTGLGLALVKRLAEQHGGTVRAESTGVPGEGSCFTVVLPLTDGEAPAPAKEEATPQPAPIAVPSAQSAAARVLLAEDNELSIVAMCEYLEHVGYEVVVARTGPEALQQAEATLPDVILMDIQLPLLDGMSVMRKLRADQRFAATPIVATTALAAGEDREQCLRAGATAYISKPMRMSELTALMKELLQRGE